MNIFTDYGSWQSQGPRDEQQDRFRIMPDQGVLAVFDGHGRDGAQAAQIAAANLTGNFRPYFDKDELIIPSPNLTRHFGQLSSKMSGLRGGTTATVIGVTPVYPYDSFRTITANNVGDSPAYLIDPRHPDRENGILRLTEHHDATNFKEVSRMRKLGHGVFQNYEDGPQYFHNGRGGGIMISRALGDHDTPGLISTPSFNSWQSRAERILLVATDGVLNEDTTDSAIEETLRLFRRHRRMYEIAQALVDTYSYDTNDNATALVAHIPRA